MPAWESETLFRKFFKKLRLRYFKANELTTLFQSERNGVRNSPPAPALWGNIAPTLIVLDALRERMNAPISLSSAYRSPEYNAAVGGAPASLHTAFSAVDFYLENGKQEAAAETLLNWQGRRFRCPVPIRSEADQNDSARLYSLRPADEKDGWSFEFNGGVGYYRAQQFVHLDTRGRGAVWQDTPALMERIAQETRGGMRRLIAEARAHDPSVLRRLSRLADKALAELDADNAPPAARKGALQKLDFLIQRLENSSIQEAETAIEELSPLWPIL